MQTGEKGFLDSEVHKDRNYQCLHEVHNYKYNVAEFEKL